MQVVVGMVGVGMREVEFGCFVVVGASTSSWMMCGKGVVGERGERESRLGRIWIEGRVFRVAILGHGTSSSCEVEMVLPYLDGGGFWLDQWAIAMVGCR